MSDRGGGRPRTKSLSDMPSDSHSSGFEELSSSRGGGRERSRSFSGTPSSSDSGLSTMRPHGRKRANAIIGNPPDLSELRQHSPKVEEGLSDMDTQTKKPSQNVNAFAMAKLAGKALFFKDDNVKPMGQQMNVGDDWASKSHQMKTPLERILAAPKQGETYTPEQHADIKARAVRQQAFINKHMPHAKFASKIQQKLENAFTGKSSKSSVSTAPTAPSSIGPTQKNAATKTTNSPGARGSKGSG